MLVFVTTPIRLFVTVMGLVGFGFFVGFAVGNAQAGMPEEPEPAKKPKPAR